MFFKILLLNKVSPKIEKFLNLKFEINVFIIYYLLYIVIIEQYIFNKMV